MPVTRTPLASCGQLRLRRPSLDSHFYDCNSFIMLAPGVEKKDKSLGLKSLISNLFLLSSCWKISVPTNALLSIEIGDLLWPSRSLWSKGNIWNSVKKFKCISVLWWHRIASLIDETMNSSKQGFIEIAPSTTPPVSMISFWRSFSAESLQPVWPNG